MSPRLADGTVGAGPRARGDRCDLARRRKWPALRTLLLDARMPDTDGLTLAATIRERVELADTRIILMTSGEGPGDLSRCASSGSTPIW